MIYIHLFQINIKILMFGKGIRKKNKKRKIFGDNIKKNESFNINLEEIKQNIEKKKSIQRNGLEIKQSPKKTTNEKILIELAKNKKLEKETELTHSFISEKNVEKIAKDMLGKKREKNETKKKVIQEGIEIIKKEIYTLPENLIVETKEEELFMKHLIKLSGAGIIDIPGALRDSFCLNKERKFKKENDFLKIYSRIEAFENEKDEKEIEEEKEKQITELFGDGFFPKNNRKAKFERIIKKTQ